MKNVISKNPQNLMSTCREWDNKSETGVSENHGEVENEVEEK
jgi:hypothetical protein